LSEADLVELHHRFMVVYGWIPLQEFRDLPLRTFWNLAALVNKELSNWEEFRQYVIAMIKGLSKKRK